MSWSSTTSNICRIKLIYRMWIQGVVGYTSKREQSHAKTKITKWHIETTREMCLYYIMSS